MHYYLINRETGARFCQDGCWREFAYFGTYRACVKVWRKRSWAERAALVRSKAVILELPDGQHLDASGNILQRNKKSGNDTEIGHVDKWLDDNHALNPAESS